MRQFVQACPAMEVTAAATQAFITISQGKFGSAEKFVLLQGISRVLFVDSGKEMVVFIIVRLNAELVVAAVTEGCTNHVARVLLRTAVKGEHHFGMVSMGIAHTVLILDNLHARSERFLRQNPFIGPGTGEMGQPYIATADGQIAGSKLIEHHRLLLLMGDFSPGFYHVGILPGTVTDVDEEGIHLILQCHDSRHGIPFLFGSHVQYFELEGHVTVGMLHSEGRLHGSIQSIFGIGCMVRFCRRDILQVGFRKSVTIIQVSQCTAFRSRKHQRGFRSGYTYVLSQQTAGQQQYSKEEICSFLEIHAFLV